MLAVCLDNQEIQIYRVAVELGYKEYQEFSTIKAYRLHHHIIMPTASAMCYALGSNDFTIYAVTEAVKLHSYTSHLKNASMVLDDTNERIFVAGLQGLMSVYSLNERGFPDLACTFGPKESYEITKLVLSEDRQYLLAGTNEAQVLVFEVFKKGKQKLSQHISTILGPQNIGTLAFCKEYKLLYVSYRNNLVAINTDSTPERIIEGHSQLVLMVKYDPQAKLLISSAEDGCVCFTPYNVHPIKASKQEPAQLQLKKPETRPSVTSGIRGWPASQQ